ncbi:hypothetical protein [Streptomyces sp. NPDC047315]|uniref:hypothetical protein n=1 Tax=Streptomyces sp. NPDC047315 TaxID=3155142 RepID=UPI0033DEA930
MRDSTTNTPKATGPNTTFTYGTAYHVRCNTHVKPKTSGGLDGVTGQTLAVNRPILTERWRRTYSHSLRETNVTAASSPEDHNISTTTPANTDHSSIPHIRIAVRSGSRS